MTRVGIIGAMAVEVAHLKDEMTGASEENHAGMTFAAGRLGPTEVVVVQAGVGKVNAGICASVLCEVYGCTHVLFTGVAGSLNASINIGDLVVSTDAVHHDFDVCNLGYAPGEIPDMGRAAFPADPALRSAVVEAAAAVAPEVQVFEGRVATGDQFVRDDAEKDRIVKTFGALCTAMEGAAVAQACYLYQVPFVIVRAISDKADGSAQVDYPTFEKEAADRSAKIVAHMVAHHFA